jgi:hypothetical protein
LRLLLLSCSATKRPGLSLLPAIERYDGPTYRVLRRNRPPELAVWILSAQFGLISEAKLIPDYNRRMSLRQAQELQTASSAKLDQILVSGDFTSIFLNMGKVYAVAFKASCALPMLRVRGCVNEAHEGIGDRLRQMKQWLLCPEVPDNGLFPDLF